MSGIIQITNSKDNDIEFDVKVEGIAQKDMSVHLIIETRQFELGFKCENVGAEKWRCKIPPLAFIEKTAFPFRVQVVVDGYLFEPFKGTANVISTADIYVSISNAKIGAPDKLPASIVAPGLSGEQPEPEEQTFEVPITQVAADPTPLSAIFQTLVPTESVEEPKLRAKKIIAEKKTDDIIDKIIAEKSVITDDPIKQAPAATSQADKAVHKILNETVTAKPAATLEKVPAHIPVDDVSLDEKFTRLGKKVKEKKEKIAEGDARVKAILGDITPRTH